MNIFNLSFGKDSMATLLLAIDVPVRKKKLVTEKQISIDEYLERLNER